MPQARDGRSGRFVFNRGDSQESRNTELNPLYNTWKELVSRCTNPRHVSFKHYGGAGIGIAKHWLDYEAFKGEILSTIGPRPSGHVLERLDKTGDYQPGNLRWARKGEPTYRRRGVKLDASKVSEIRALAGSMSQAAIADLYDLHQSQVSKILSGKRWANVS